MRRKCTEAVNPSHVDVEQFGWVNVLVADCGLHVVIGPACHVVSLIPAVYNISRLVFVGALASRCSTLDAQQS